jgi:predicted nucleic acid-binding protein
MRSVLLDTGPLVALFATDDKHHARFDALVLALAPKGLYLVTTLIKPDLNHTAWS